MIRCWLLGVPSLLIPSVPLLRPVKCTACTLGPALTASWLQFCVLKAGELRWGYFVVSLQKAGVLIYQDKNVLWNILKPDSAFMWAWHADCCGHKRPQSLPPALDSVTQSQEKDFRWVSSDVCPTARPALRQLFRPPHARALSCFRMTHDLRWGSESSAAGDLQEGRVWSCAFCCYWPCYLLFLEAVNTKF